MSELPATVKMLSSKRNKRKLSTPKWGKSKKRSDKKNTKNETKNSQKAMMRRHWSK